MTIPFNIYPPDPWRSAGLRCPHGGAGADGRTHQPYPDPWWEGSSVFAPYGVHVEQPTGPFYIFPDPGHTETFPSHLDVGGLITSPAERRVLPWGVANNDFDGSCSAYSHYDVHAVYITTDPDFASHDRFGTPAVRFFEVEPEGKLWPDPESVHPGSSRWCCRRAWITAVHTLTTGKE